MLFSIAQELNGPRVDTQPNIDFLPEAQIRGICGGRCLAVYQHPNIFLADSIDLATVEGQGILYHELVHHYQERQERYGEEDSCSRWNFREQEAYELQESWYQRHGLARKNPHIYRRC